MAIYSLEQLTENSKRFSIKHILKEHAYVNFPLNFEESYLLGVYALMPFIDSLKKDNLFSTIAKEIEGREEGILSISINEGYKNLDKSLARLLLTEKQALASMCSLHTKATYNTKPNESEKRMHLENNRHYLPENSAEQIAGISAAIFDYDIALSHNGFLNPKVEFAIDNCGMGGDIYKTPNISTISALIAASAGIPMCKHGSPGNADAGKHGSSDFVAMVLNKRSFEELIGIPKEKVEKAIEKYGFGYTEALDPAYKRVHLLTHRSSLLPHMNDIIGPMTNPLDKRVASKKIVGVNHLIPTEIVAEAFKILNQKGVTAVDHGLFVRGYVDAERVYGIDELSILPGGSSITELKDGKIIGPYDIRALEFGINEVSYDEINPGERKGEFSYQLMTKNRRGRVMDMILANTALIFHIKTGKSLRECYQMAENAFESRLFEENMNNLREHFR